MQQPGPGKRRNYGNNPRFSRQNGREATACEVREVVDSKEFVMPGKINETGCFSNSGAKQNQIW